MSLSSKGTPRGLPFFVLAIGLVAVSFGAILARYAQAAEVPSLAVAAWRLGIAALVITPFALRSMLGHLGAAKREALTSRFDKRQFMLIAAAGLSLAGHFATWITSLEYTSVASSVALVTTNPLWIGLASFVLFKEVPSRWLMGGVALSLVGSLLIFLSDSSSSSGSNPMLGNVLAIMGSWCFSAYLMIGRRLRAGLSLSLYIWLVYGIAAILLFGSASFNGVATTGFAYIGWLALVGMALGPQVVGHTSYNWALKHVSPAFVAVVTLGEPVACALMAYVFFNESLAGLQSIGFVFLLMGIYLASKNENA